MRDRQHRHFRLVVVRLHKERECPEMGWGPHEDQSEHQNAFGADPASGHGPANHRREGACGTPDDDVLRRVVDQ